MIDKILLLARDEKIITHYQSCQVEIKEQGQWYY